jgi:hypothetical protein
MCVASSTRSHHHPGTLQFRQPNSPIFPLVANTIALHLEKWRHHERKRSVDAVRFPFPAPSRMRCLGLD